MPPAWSLSPRLPGFSRNIPDWQSVAQTIENFFQGRLMPQRSRGAGDGFSSVAAPDSYAAAQPIDEKIIDPRTQDWSSSFGSISKPCRRGLRVSRRHLGRQPCGTGSTMSTPQGRLLQGLRSVIAVYEFDATPDAAAIMKRFAGVLSGGGDAPSSLLPQLQSVLKQGENLLHYSGSVPEFAPDSLFYQWLQEFRDLRVITRTNRPLSLRPLGMRSRTPIGRSGNGLRWGPCPG